MDHRRYGDPHPDAYTATDGHANTNAYTATNEHANANAHAAARDLYSNSVRRV